MSSSNILQITQVKSSVMASNLPPKKPRITDLINNFITQLNQSECRTSSSGSHSSAFQGYSELDSDQVSQNSPVMQHRFKSIGKVSRLSDNKSLRKNESSWCIYCGKNKESSEKQGHDNKIQLLNLHQKLKKKNEFIRYLQKKCANQIIKSTKRIEHKIVKLEQENQRLTQKLKSLSTDSNKPLSLPHDGLSSGKNTKTRNQQKFKRANPFQNRQSRQREKQGRFRQFSTSKQLHNNSTHSYNYIPKVNETLIDSSSSEKSFREIKFIGTKNTKTIKINQITQTQLPVVSFGMQTQDDQQLKQMKLDLQLEIVGLRVELQQSVQAGKSIQIIADRQYQPKNSIERNYFELLQLFQINWDEYENSEEVHQMMLIELNSIKKQLDSMYKQFKKLQTQISILQDTNQLMNTMTEDEREENKQMKVMYNGVLDELHFSNAQIIKLRSILLASSTNTLKIINDQ